MVLYDSDIREPLFDYLEEQYGIVRFLEEKTIGQSRADVVMVTPTALYGIEIKSDADTYARLERQVKDYNKFYQYNYVVIGSKHAHHIDEHVPAWWGIVSVEYEDNHIDFYEVRKPIRNPKWKLDYQIGLLWRPELAKLQEWNHLPKYEAKSKRFVQVKLQEKVPAPDLEIQICECLMERDYTSIAEEIKNYRKQKR